jgi:Zn ribbon nucleic-acid-binding protein
MATATKSKTRTSFGVTCPHCRSEDDTVTINLNDLVECRCAGCDETFSPMEAREMVAAELARWDAVCRWVEMAGTMVGMAKE